ncbi:hypothetical protein GCK32_021091 [Trichostrongylus colubriformis]|uniref:Uncharacterized protein n=1 Tax=Trichostrongylus colubriformis TaxID=6319 RepID=A0AAN8IIY1_TRICO
MFDKWTEMVAAHIKTYEEMVSMQKEALQQVVDIVKSAFSAQHFRRTPSKRTSNGQTRCRDSFSFEVF